MSKPRLLDLFCCAGGAAMGYVRAGFEVVGVDIDPQPHYPFEFHQADALTFPLDSFDAIHASPPCQAYSVSRHTARKAPTLRLIEPVRERLTEYGMPWVIENVPNAPLRDPVICCGAAFGLVARDADGAALVLKRHRAFESNVSIVGTPCACAGWREAGIAVGGNYGHGDGVGTRRNGRGYVPARPVRCALMGIDWGVSTQEVAEAIPPVFTHWLGRQLMAALNGPQDKCNGR